MKKLLGISLVAVLAVSPLVASAADVAPSTTLTSSNTTETGLAAGGSGVIVAANPYYAGKTITDNDRQRAATAAYVKGAYNDAISAVNKVHASKQDTIGDLSTIRSGAAAGATALQESSISTGTENGKITVGTKEVSVYGLGSAAYTDSGAYATAAQGTKADSAVQSVKVNNQALTETDGAVNITVAPGTAAGTIKVNGSDVAVTGVLTQHQSLTDYAKKTGVTQTITNSTITGTVPAVTDWANETTGSVAISAGITGATYAEPQS